MNTKTTIVLLIIVIVCGLFIYFYERNQLTTDELEERKEKVFKDFNKDKVSKLLIQTTETKTIVEKKKVGDEFEWEMIEPVKAKAQSDEVEAVLSAIEWLQKKRSVEKQGIVSRGEYGVGEPGVEVHYWYNGREIGFKIGNEAPGDSIYLSINGDNDHIYVVEKEFLDQVKKEPSQLRDKTVSGISMPQVIGIKKIKGKAELKLEGRYWNILSPYKIRADKNVVEGLIREIEGIKVHTFVEDNVTNLTSYGLDNPDFEIQIDQDRDEKQITLRFGKECSTDPGYIYVTKLGSKSVSCVNKSIINSLGRDIAEFRDRRTVNLETAEIDQIVYERGKNIVKLAFEDDVWNIVEPQPKKEADSETIDKIIKSLQQEKASDIAIIPENGDLSNYGLKQPLIVIKLKRSEDRNEEVINIGQPLGSGSSDSFVYVRRGNEGALLQFQASQFDWIGDEDPVALFRSRKVLNEDSFNAVNVMISGPISQEIKKEDDEWKIISPEKVKADQTTMDEITRGIAGLTVDSFVSGNNKADFGLTRPFVTVQVTFKVLQEESQESKNKVYTLFIGSEVAEKNGSRYAQLDGEDSVFVVSKSFISPLIEPLINKDVFQIDETKVSSITINRQGFPAIQLNKRENDWINSQGGIENRDGIERIMNRFNSVRATKVISFNTDDPQYGFNNPRARLNVVLEEEEIIIEIGNVYEGENGEKGAYARRGDIKAVFVLSESAVNSIVNYGQQNSEEEQEEPTKQELLELIPEANL